MKKRKPEIVVISDVHLGTISCYADELLTYLNSIQPKTLVLNGGILGASTSRLHHFPTSHISVIHKILQLSIKGTKVYYVNDKGDEAFFSSKIKSLGNIEFCERLILQVDQKKIWFFNGAFFNANSKYTTWLTQFGPLGEKMMIGLNKWLKSFFGIPKKEGSGFIESDTSEGFYTGFENFIVDIALENDYDHVVSGYIQKPKKELHRTKKGTCTYLNSGDWVKNLTALEYSFKRWKIYKYDHDKLSAFYADAEIKQMNIHELVTSIANKAAAKKSEKDIESIE
ncbi:UDP-2,3-diacylglucosamine diphosphatase [Maribacter sp. 2210JD10-5]|uniref:UDP-2,3-diacylglucosamine diphosphatase n=1 Tax=Maribacter sp. 2210JD10-5 TaxID=3386272 RepID=UPI0039BD2828